jgi:hypothetical protein
MYTRDIMGKRSNSVGKMKTTSSHKTAKRLAIKKEMLQERALNKNNRNYTGR